MKLFDRMNPSAKGLAVFDFDGTISSRDSFLEFIRFTHGSWALYKALLWHWISLLLYLLKIVSNDRLKEKIFSHFYRGMPRKELDALGRDFSTRRLPDLCYPGALERLIWHRRQKHRIVILTASSAIWLGEWCEKMGVDLVGTAFELQDGLYTGKIEGKNCWGAEKLRRLENFVDLESAQPSYGYGNHISDWFFLERMQHQYFKPFKSKR